MGLFSPSHAFSGGFWQISLKRSLYVKNWKKSFLRPLFRATFPLNTDLNSSSGSLWDPLRPSGTPLGTPQGVPEEELKSEFNREVARTIIPSFPVELQLKFVLWDPLGRGEYFYSVGVKQLQVISFLRAEIFNLECFVQKYSYYGVLCKNIGQVSLHVTWKLGKSMNYMQI